MNPSKMQKRTIGKAVLALALASIIGGIAVVPARADDRDWRHDDRDWRHDERVERHDRDWYRHHHVVVAPTPGYVVAPPVVYAPPPPPPGISLVFPLAIR